MTKPNRLAGTDRVGLRRSAVVGKTSWSGSTEEGARRSPEVVLAQSDSYTRPEVVLAQGDGSTLWYKYGYDGLQHCGKCHDGSLPMQVGYDRIQ